MEEEVDLTEEDVWMERLLQRTRPRRYRLRAVVFLLSIVLPFALYFCVYVIGHMSNFIKSITP